MSAIFHAGISGARGRMGRAVSTVLDAREDVVVAARFDRGETPDLSLCDVIIDFSTPDASVELAQACAAASSGRIDDAGGGSLPVLPVLPARLSATNSVRPWRRPMK